MTAKSIVFRAPAVTASGYGVHARQIAKWLLKLQDEKPEIDVTFELVPWGITPWYVDPKACNGLIGQIIQNSGKKEKYDVSFQLQLPNEWDPFLAQTNIGITAGVEADRCNPAWINAINRMDRVVVPSEFTKQCFNNTGDVKTQIDVIPESWFEECRSATKENSVLAQELQLETDFNFLVVSQFTGNNPENDRKNISFTIKWLLEQFHDTQNVGLILKTNFGRQTKADKQNTLKVLSQLLMECRRGPFPRVYLLHGQMTNQELAGLYTHPKVKALVNLTRGEGFCGLDYTPIVTENGLKRLDSVKVGEKVLTHKGRFMRVTQELSREYNGEMIQITPFNSSLKTQPIVLTPNHSVYTFNGKNYLWKKAKDLAKGDFVCFPKFKFTEEINQINISDFMAAEYNNFFVSEEGYIEYKQSNKLGYNIKNKIELNANFGKLIGYYLAEGCSCKGSINFSLHKNEKETLAQDIINSFKTIFNLENYRFQEYENSNRMTLIFESKILSVFFENLCGKGAKEKFVADVLFKTNSSFKEGLLTGLLLGDGYIKTNSKPTIEMELCNENLIRQIRLILLEQGIISNTSVSRKIGIIKERWEYDSYYYKLRISNFENTCSLFEILNRHSTEKFLINHEYKNNGKNKFFKNDEMFCFEIKELMTISHNGKVYNLSVEEDETYCTENFVVHNCLPVLEAATCGLPILTTGWSGHTEFLGLGKYMKVEYDMVEIHETRADEQIWMRGSRWANPIESDVKRKLRRFHGGSAIPTQWAKDLRPKLLEQYSPEAIQKIYSELLEDLLQ